MELPTELWKERERGTTHILREMYIGVENNDDAVKFVLKVLEVDKAIMK